MFQLLVVVYQWIRLADLWLSSVVKNYEGLLAARFMLGFSEGGLMPGISYYLSCFYRRSELLLRIGWFINGACLAGAFGGLFAAGLSQIPAWGTKAVQIHTWRNIFFFEGLLTVAIGLGVIKFFPSTPSDCMFLSDRDRYIAAERINQEYQEARNDRITKKDIYRGIFNINTIICGFSFMFANVAVQSIALFMPTIIAAMGHQSIRAQLYTVPVYAVATIVSLFMAWLSDRLNKRGYFISSGALIALAGYAILSSITDANVKYAGVYIACIGIFFIGTTVLAWALNNTAGNSVRAVSSAFVVTMGNFGSLVAVWSYLAEDAPLYKKGHFINMGAEAIVCVLGIAGVIHVRWENRQRSLGKRDSRLQGLSQEEIDGLGYRHPNFRYIE
jgi:MFS family permease